MGWTVGKVGWVGPRSGCFSFFGFAASNSGFTMSPDGTRAYAGLSTDYDVYDFDAVGWSFVGSVTLQSLYGVSGTGDWNFAGGFWLGNVVHPGSGLMYAFDNIIELDGGATVPGAHFQGSLLRFDPDDGSAFEVPYRWSENADATTTSAYLWWHPHTPDLIWIVKEFDGAVDIQSFDTTTDTIATVATDIWPGVNAGFLSGFSLFEYETGFAWVLHDGTSDYRLCAYDVDADALATLDASAPAGVNDPDYPMGLDYSGRFLFSSTGVDAVDGYRQITPGSIGSLTAYTDCDVFLDEDDFPARTFFWYAPADRSVVYIASNNRIWSMTP